MCLLQRKRITHFLAESTFAEPCTVSLYNAIMAFFPPPPPPAGFMVSPITKGVTRQRKEGGKEGIEGGRRSKVAFVLSVLHSNEVAANKDNDDVLSISCPNCIIYDHTWRIGLISVRSGNFDNYILQHVNRCRIVQHEHLPMNCLSIKLSKVPPLLEIKPILHACLR